MLRFLLFLTLITLPLRAVAQDHCTAILSLSQLQAAIERVAAPGHRRIDRDMDMVRRILLRADAANTNYTLRDHALASQAAAITEFFVTAQAASAYFQAGQRDRALNYLMSDDPRRVVIVTGLMLRGYDCRISSERVTTSLTQISVDTPSRLDPVAFTRKQALLTFGLSVALVPICIFLIRRQIRRLALKRRRQKRHFVEIPAQLVTSHLQRDIQNSQLWEPAEVIDLSCEGAKIQLWAELCKDAPPKITLMFDGKTLPATVIWANQHYAGIKFASKLDFRTLRILIRNNPPSGRTTEPPRKRTPSPAIT